MAGRKKFVKRHAKSKLKDSNEPEIKDYTKEELIRVLSWYNQQAIPEKTRKAWVIEYSNNKLLKKVNEKFFQGTLPTVCRLANRGFVLSNEHKEWTQSRINVLLERISEEKEVTKDEQKYSIQDRMLEQAKEVMGEIEYFIDQKLIHNEENRLNLILQEKNFGRQHISHLLTYLNKTVLEYNELKDDREVLKDFGYSIRKINSMTKYLDSLIEECNNWILAKKKLRKPTSKRTKAPLDLCKRVKISENTFVRPTKVINSNYVLVYNIKSRILTLLVSDDNDGLSIKGTSIVNYDPKKSRTYKLKDDSVLEMLRTKVQIRSLKVFIEEEKKIKESKAKPTGRLGVISNIIVTI